MAGPVASVIVRDPLSSAQRAMIADHVSSKALRVEDDRFWVAGRPFVWYTGEEYPGELTEADLSGLLGWQPRDQVTFVAMCNDDVDHRTLAELCVEVGHLLDGLIDFGGSLRGDINPTVGRLWARPIESVSGPAFSHFGTPGFLAWWLEQPHFRMVK